MKLLETDIDLALGSSKGYRLKMPVVGLSCATAGAPNEAGHITRVCDEAHRGKVRIRVEWQKETTHAAGKAEKRYCAHTPHLHKVSP